VTPDGVPRAFGQVTDKFEQQHLTNYVNYVTLYYTFDQFWLLGRSSEYLLYSCGPVHCEAAYNTFDLL
jgi:hypothetical protein